jgi:hypothetical protein
VPTRDVVKARIQALVRIRKLRAGPADQWLRLGDEAMNDALNLGARARIVREAAGLPVEPMRSALVIELADGRALVQLHDGESRWMPAAGHTSLGARLLVTEEDLYPRDSPND